MPMSHQDSLDNIKLFDKVFDVEFLSNSRFPKRHKNADGLCYFPRSSTGKGKIKIRKKLKPKDMLRVELHECLHGAFWFFDEATVDMFSTHLANYLWKRGYRLKED